MSMHPVASEGTESRTTWLDTLSADTACRELLPRVSTRRATSVKEDALEKENGATFPDGSHRYPRIVEGVDTDILTAQSFCLVKQSNE